MSTKPAGMPVRRLFQEEARFGRLSDHRRCWAPWPSPPLVGQQVIREYTYALLAVSPQDGRLSSLVLPWVDTQTMSIFLTHTASEFPGDYCLMLRDGAGWHRATGLQVPPTIRLIPLPPYSPELNPVEHVWEYLRENHFGNRVFPSLTQVVDHLCQGLRALHQQPELLQSMTSFDWIKSLCLTLN